MSRDRLHNIDLLRLILMMMIVTLHYYGWTGLRSSTDIPSYNRIIAQCLSSLSWCAVNAFFMISGFLIRNKEVSISGMLIVIRIVKIWAKVFLINAIIYLLAIIGGVIPINVESLFCMMCPILSNRYWFITVFLLLTAVIPFIQNMLVRLSNVEVLILSLVLLTFDSIQPLFEHNGFGENGYGFLHSLTCLLIGYTIKRYYSVKIGRGGYFLVYIASCFVGVILYTFINSTFKINVSILLCYNSPFYIMAAVGLICFFNSLSIKNKVVSKLAPFSLGIFLIQSQVIRDYIWEDFSHISFVQYTPYLLLHYLIVLVICLLAGITIDGATSKVIEFLTNKRLKYS